MNRALCVILAACLAAPALAQQVAGAEKVTLAGIFGWWLPTAGAQARQDAYAAMLEFLERELR